MQPIQAGVVISGAMSLAPSLPPRSGGEGRPTVSAFTRVFDALWAVGVGGACRLHQLPPTPDPSPPLASLAGGGEKGAVLQ
jgi:hypothetical protein